MHGATLAGAAGAVFHALLALPYELRRSVIVAALDASKPEASDQPDPGKDRDR